MAQGYSGRSPYQSLTGNGTPIIVPQFIGQIYIDNLTASAYIGTSTLGSFAWAFIGKGLINTFTKNTVPGLISWYKADYGPSPTTEGTHITSWTDSSDTGNTLTSIIGTTRAYTSNVQNGF